ncbi:MAG: hypothetical protein HY399_04725, partial [Elusimicrobia bacterium]|nr:hypothetical protein [Elusimicrobiota bacterium]
MGQILILFLLVIHPSVLFAGNTLSLNSSQFSSGSHLNTGVASSSLSLLKGWNFAGQAPVSARYHTGFAFDEIRKQAVLFGGHDDAGNVLGDTWVWDAVTGWTQKTPIGPPAPRYGHGLVWMGDKFLLFGGSSGNDTWTYDIVSNTWTFVGASPSPASRNFFSMAYDSDQNKVVVFGGVSDNATWIYNVAASSWSLYSLSPAPSARWGTSMAYDPIQRKMILFGGMDWNASIPLQDTWSFDVANKVWSQKNPPSKPEARSQSAMVYDARNGRLFLYGGLLNSGLAGDSWFYDVSGDKWAQYFEFDSGAPAGHFGHGMIYDMNNDQAMVFGGKQDVAVQSVWRYHFRSSGTWISDSIDAWSGFSTTAPITWDTLSTFFSSQPVATDVLLQLSCSDDGTAYDAFRGPDGSPNTFYLSSSTPQAIWSGCRSHRYLKLRAQLLSNDPPGRPRVSEFRFGYDRAPYAPSLSSPGNQSRINDSTPLFRWNLTSDQDGIFTDSPLLYQIQVDSYSLFSAPIISEENIPAGSSDVSFSTGTILPEGVWYWRVRAKDPAGLYGFWSSTYSLTLDTHTPPSAVTQLSASIGSGNGSISLSWTFPGDDKGRVDNGMYRIRFSSVAALLTETDWSQAQEQSGLFSADPGEALQTLVTSLKDNSTYYFAVKTEDELGNLSPLSTVSPFALTNASPTVALVFPDGGEVIQRIISINWNDSDPNPGDTQLKALNLSTDGGTSFSVLIASDLPTGTTFYAWDSRMIPNGSNYRIRIDVVDQRGLSASDTSNGNFSVDNINEAPIVQFSTAPSTGENISGLFNVSWGVSDPNTLDTHTYDLLLSSDSGSTFSHLVSGITQTSYALNTRNYPNLSTYRLKVVAFDSGTPVLTGTAFSPVFSIVNSSAPLSFRLLKPLQEDFPTIFDLKFVWEAAVDPEGDPVTYTLEYSTRSDLNGATGVSGISQPQYTPPLNSLEMDKNYFWQVTAQDPFVKKTSSTQESFRLSKTKAKSSDGSLQVEVLSALPSQSFLKFENANVSDQDLMNQAELDSKAQRLFKPLSYPVWRLKLQDLMGSVLPSDTLEARLTYTLPDQKSLSVTVSDKSLLKVAVLNEVRGRW